MTRPLPFAALAVLLPACAHAPAGVPSGAAAEARAADAAWSTALGAGDREAWLAAVADDAVFGGGRRVLRGRPAIAAGWAVFFGPAAPRFSWRPDGGGAAPSGDLAWTTGSFRLEAKGAGGAPEVTKGRYLSVWSRGPDGRWRAELDCGYRPAAEAGAIARTPLRTLASADGALEATLGTWRAEAGPGTGAFLTVRARRGDAMDVVLDSAMPFQAE